MIENSPISRSQGPGTRFSWVLSEIKTLFALLILLLSLGISARANDSAVPNAVRTIPPEDSRWDWWREARFGMFIHWGPSSVKGTEISWSRKGVRRDRNETAEDVGKLPEWARGTVPADEYDNLYRRFDPEKFNAEDWVKVIKASGVRYVVLVAKHHDGFCMFDSKLTDYKITNTPFKRDVCAEFAKACRTAGIPVGFYYSPPDWHHPDFFTENHSRYLEYMHGQVRELLSNYGAVSVLWFDREFGKNTPETWGNESLFPMIRGLQPQMLICDRCGGWGDFTSKEDGSGYDDTHPWESCTTVGDQWGWKPNPSLKSLDECLKTLLRTVGGDGNFLLNMSPTPQGEFDPAIAARFKEIGTWLEKYGESVYGTRGGPYRPGLWGASTRKGNAIYLHIFDWSGNEVVLPPLPRKQISKAEVLTGGTIGWKTDDSGLVLTVPEKSHQNIDTIVKLELSNSASDIKVLDVPISLPLPGKANVRVSASNMYGNDPEYSPDKAFDGDPRSRWATDGNVHQAWLAIDLGNSASIKKIQIDEPAEYQRIRAFELQYKVGAGWKTFYTGTRMGPGFGTPEFNPPINCREVRLNITSSTDGPTISEFRIAR